VGKWARYEIAEVIVSGRKAFNDWCHRFEVRDTFPADAFDPSRWKERQIWTELFDDGGMIVAGFESDDSSTLFPVAGYYVSELEWDCAPGEDAGVPTSFVFPCSSCEDPDEIQCDCVSCGGEGEFKEFLIPTSS